MTPAASPRPPPAGLGLSGLNDSDPDSPLSDLGEYTFDSDIEADLKPPGPPLDTRISRSPSSQPAEQPCQAATATNGHSYAKEAATTDENSSPDDGGPPDDAPADDERPAKRRRIRDSTPPNTTPRPKPISPPWKKVEADGPSTILENGRRKSGRIFALPVENRLTPDPRARVIRGSTAASPASPRTSGGSSRAASTPRSSSHRPSSQKSAKPEPKPSRTSTRAAPRENKAPPRHSPPVPTRQSTRTRKPPRYGVDAEPLSLAGARSSLQDTNSRGPRIRLRVRQDLDTLPLLHPDHLTKRVKLFPTLDEYWERAWEIPLEDGGLYSADDDARIPDDAARREAEIIHRIEQEVEPGGLLSQGRCSAFVPKQRDEPPKQWSHADHLAKAASNFRRLLVAEHARHKALAKKLAEGCRDEWIRKQPKSHEELEREARELWVARYRLVARAVLGTWENVRAEINRRKVEELEAEEQRRVKAALNEAVNLSEQKLQARKAKLGSEASSDEEDIDLDSDLGELGESDLDDLSHDGDSEGGGEESEDEGVDADDDDNMSSSDEEEEDEVKDDGGDANLTHEQLLAKYANLPDLPQDPEAKLNNKLPNGEEVSTPAADDDTSDESVNMDDDLGSSDMGSDDDDESGEEGSDEEESEDDAAGGMLGFLGKSELQRLKEQAAAQSTENNPSPSVHFEDDVVPDQDDIQEYTPKTNGYKYHEEGTDDDDAVSLIHHPGDNLNAESGTPPTPQTHDHVEGAPLPITNGTTSSPLTRQATDPHLAKAEPTSPSSKTVERPEPEVAPPRVVDGYDDDITMHDAPPVESSKAPSPETDPHSAERSQSPRTSDTKPSDLDTPSASDLVRTREAASPSPSSAAAPGPKTEIPFLLRGTLREYQHYGLDWLAGLYANNTNGILADEMGLGKTIQTIALLAHLACNHQVWGPHLIIVPTSVMLNWEMEFKKWCPGFKILAYYGSQEERKRKRQGWNNDDVWNVCVTSYQLALQDAQVFKRRRWHYMILDEAHNIKNFKSQRWQTLLGFNTHSRLLLTGTPLQNNLTELWSLLFFLMPSESGGAGRFADLHEFHDWFHKPESQILESGKETMDDEARAIIAKLHKVLRPYLLRRLKADVEKQMPAKYEHVEFCRLSKRQRELYDGFLARSDTRNTLASGNYLSIINCLMQLRKVCNHPDLFVDRPIMTSFPMERSVAGAFEYTDKFVRGFLLADNPMERVNLAFLNLVPTMHEHISTHSADTIARLANPKVLMEMREAQRSRATRGTTTLNATTVNSTLARLEGVGRWTRFEELQHCVYLNALRRQQRPIYGANLVRRLTLDLHDSPRKLRSRVPRKVLSWFEEDSVFIQSMVKSVERRSSELQTTIERFACITPAVVAKDLHAQVLGSRGIQSFQEEDLKLSRSTRRWAPFMPPEPPLDPWHESRMRLSIQFPDKRLLQYDCGKLQTLDRLLRRLQAGGHRALIFTQMTKVLDILEQFLNIHGHKYLRLDGATKVEQRQILTDRFNNDPRILCFILSTRSGGLGINLTGADTVIFYDQDWNPAMDKQCQDRCHRIGQTRDVHIYRLVSEHTIEANILRKASQKQMLDDVVIQEGEFTTDYFNKLPTAAAAADSSGDERGARGESEALLGEGVAAANAAMDRVLGVGAASSGQDDEKVGRELAMAEDKEDVTAARAVEREIHADEVDFQEKAARGGSVSGPGSGVNTPGGGPGDDGAEGEQEINAFGGTMRDIDQYMLAFMGKEMEGAPVEMPRDKKKGKKKKGKDTRKR